MTDLPTHRDLDRDRDPDDSRSEAGHDVVASSDPDTPEVAATVVETADDPAYGVPGTSHDVVASSDPDTPGAAATVVEDAPETDDPRR